ncbi:HEAT repeat domain-containing protein [Nocardia sp. NPDC058379]|uniref:HEAT repeat domain-containing protein n=1 Tax=unclassified Nocardia TaxID=2637762 RepID=UPI0036542F3B
MRLEQQHQPGAAHAQVPVGCVFAPACDIRLAAAQGDHVIGLPQSAVAMRGGAGDTESMPTRIWQSTPRQSIERECRRRGRPAFVEGCSRMLDGDDSDIGLVVALGGPLGQDLIDRGMPAHQRYWLRVWAGRGLFWVWGDEAFPYLAEAAEDEQWRVREWVAKVIGKHGLTEAKPVLRRLIEDSTPRVSTAARRALCALDDLPEPPN